MNSVVRKPQVGDDVLFAFADEYSKTGIIERPAKVLRVHSDTCVNLVVFVDGYNDERLLQAGEQHKNSAPTMMVWRTSATLSADGETHAWQWRRSPIDEGILSLVAPVIVNHEGQPTKGATSGPLAGEMPIAPGSEDVEAATSEPTKEG